MGDDAFPLLTDCNVWLLVVLFIEEKKIENRIVTNVVFFP